LQKGDCGVGSSADMPRSIWLVMKENISNPFDCKPVAAFCNKRFGEFWIKNQPEDSKRQFKYSIFPGIGNPEVYETL